MNMYSAHILYMLGFFDSFITFRFLMSASLSHFFLLFLLLYFRFVVKDTVFPSTCF